VDSFIQEKLLNPSIESKVRCIIAITALLQNAVEVDQAQIAKEGILQMMLTMAGSEEYLKQLVASEAIIAAAQKKDSSILISQGINVVKRLYKSKNDHIRVRALVGLCKLGKRV
jgi:protein unc-45